jgi:V/A-type H+-transporting ATPase subunit A
MLKVINSFYKQGVKAVKLGIPIAIIMDRDLIERIYKMKYNIPNDNLNEIDDLENDIANYMNNLIAKYR